MTEEDYKLVREHPCFAVKGLNPYSKDMADWKPEKWLEFIKFANFHLKRTEGANGGVYEKWVINEALIKDLENRLLHEKDYPWAEFSFRVGQFTWDNKSVLQYKARLNQSLMKTVMTYIKKHPSVLTEEMRFYIEKFPKILGYAIKQYYVRDTPYGPIVQRDSLTPTGNLSMPSMQAKYMTMTLTAIDEGERMIKELSKRSLRDLETKELVTSFKALVDTLTKLKTQGITSNQFTQININGSVEDMEKANLAFVKQKNE